jgi:hypothetical protein
MSRDVGLELFFVSASFDAQLIHLGIGEGAFSHAYASGSYSRMEKQPPLFNCLIIT